MLRSVPVALETRFTGTTSYLPSNATGLWQIFSPVLVTVDIGSPIAVNDTVTVTGSVVDNQLVGISDHDVQLVVEGIVLASLVTDANGDFTFDWLVPDIFDFGNNTLFAEVAPQGYYRGGEGNASFFLSHRSWVTLEFVNEDRDATRGDTWELFGRLYDFDTVDRDGLVGEELLVSLDGAVLFSTTTGSDGVWSAIVPATTDLSREASHHRCRIRRLRRTFARICREECVGLVGCIDSNRFNIDPNRDTFRQRGGAHCVHRFGSRNRRQR